MALSTIRVLGPALAGLLALALAGSAVSADVVGEIGVDWLGNDIVIEAVEDPDVKG
jgi:CreA protein